MASDEQFSLCWNNFHSNMSTGFHGLLSRGDLVDVTLAAEGRLLQAHKLVLSVCSPYFQEMFKMNPSQHPIVFLKDVSHSALRDLLQFMYQGEVNVKQEELASFISTAEQLQVKGLTGNQNDDSSTPASKPKPSSRPGPRSSQQRQSLNKAETDLDSKPITPVALKRPNRPSITPSNPQSSQPAPAKRKCIDPLEAAGPSGAAVKDDFVTIPDDEDNAAVAPKMEPEFVNESIWEDDDDGANNDDGNFGEDDSNMDMTGFGDGSVTGDTTIAGAAGEGGAVGDAQETPGAANTHARRPQNSAQQHYPEHVPTEDWFYIKSSKGTVQLVATNNIFYEDINSHEKRITWRCSKFYTKTPDRDRCQVSICLRSGYLAYVKGQHNHPDTYIISKHASRRCEVDMTGKYKITGEWLPGKNPLLNKSNPEGRIRMKDTSKLKMKKIDKPIQNLDPLNMQLNAQLLTSQMLIKLKEESINNITNSNVVNVPSNAENQPDIEEKDGISWHIPTFDGFF